jgi:hypothetical protein
LDLELLAMAAWTTRDMRRAAGLAREELLPGLGGDEVPRADVLPSLDGDEVSKADVRTSLPPERALVGVLSIARRIDVGLGVCPITRR